MSGKMVKNAKDGLLINLVRSCTNLTESDIHTLLEVSHSLPFISCLERGDTYINVLTKSGESMVIAQYRHPCCDLYKRDIVGEIEKKTDEPAVYRALEYGLSGRGLIGIIDGGRIMVRHTVSPIYNSKQRVIGALTYEYPNTYNSDTEPLRIRNTPDGKSVYLDKKIDKVAGRLQDGVLLFDETGACTFVNSKAEEIYWKFDGHKNVLGCHYDELHLTACSFGDIMKRCGVIRTEVNFADRIIEAHISTILNEDGYGGIAAILQDKTKIRQMEDEIAYRIASINEVHHRVKNNLQTIISLVGLEAAQTSDAEVKSFAKTIISRICSISVTYDLLAHTGTDSVNLKTMLNRVVEGSLSNCQMGNLKIYANVDGDDLDLTANVASTVALIVNELIQNSLKYAFGSRDVGTIHLTIEKGEECSWITVQDDGCGFDEKAVRKPGSGLGLKLVDSLVKSSLKGEIHVSSSSQGTQTRFSFRNGLQKSCAAG